MAKHKITMCLSPRSIEEAQKKIEEYQRYLVDKCEDFVKALAEQGIFVAKQNTGQYGQYIAFYTKTSKTATGFDGVMVATNLTHITKTWYVSDTETKTADISPLFMCEFGSGQYNFNPKGIPGGNRGDFPGQTHAFENHWSWKTKENGEWVWHSSKGEKPNSPMYKASIDMRAKIYTTARSIFG